jgi:hypothetical protein
MRIEAEEEEGFVEGIISIITTVSAQLPRLLFFSPSLFFFSSYFVALVSCFFPAFFFFRLLVKAQGGY